MQKLPKMWSSRVVWGDGPRDAPELLQGLPVVHREQVTTQSRIEPIQARAEGPPGSVAGLPCGGGW